MKMYLEEKKGGTIFVPTKKLTESRAGKDVMVVEGIFGKVNAVNDNNRRYPKRVWDINLDEASPFTRRCRRRAVMGEMEHPESGNTHLMRVSHAITKAWLQPVNEATAARLGVDPGLYVYGQAEIIEETQGGKILKALFDRNLAVGISSRGRGNVKPVDGVDEVCEDYELDTWDFVYLPSVKEAYPTVKRESKVTEQTMPELGNRGVQEEPPAEEPGVGPDRPVPVPVDPATAPAEPVAPDVVDWKAEAEATIRALEDAIAKSDTTTMIELLPRAINVVDQLASLDDEEAVKLKSQATTLMRVLSSKIAGNQDGGHFPEDEEEAEAEEEPPKKESLEQGSDTIDEQQTEEDEMKSQQVIEEQATRIKALVKENNQLKAAQENSVPMARYEQLKKLAQGLTTQLREWKTKAMRENKRVQASVKLIHKMVGEGNTKDVKTHVAQVLEKNEALKPVEDELLACETIADVNARVKSFMKLLKTEEDEDEAEAKPNEQADDEKKDEEPAAEPESTPGEKSEEPAPEPAAEPEPTPAEETPAEETPAEETPAESKKDGEKPTVSEDSKDRKSRLNGKQESSSPERPKNLMEASIRRIHQKQGRR